MKDKKSITAEVIVAIGEAAASVVGALALAVFFCGPGILPWYKK